MRAVIFSEYGEADVLHLADLPFPEIGPTEVLVRTRACGASRLEAMIRSGKMDKVALPHVLGSETTGDIAVIGDKVQGFQVGQAVAVYPYVHCGRCSFCLAGRENLCRQGGMIGLNFHGGYAQYVKAPAQCLIPLPDGLFFEDASAVILSTLTAWHVLVGLAKPEPGEWVLIPGATGGVGSAAVQVARMVGARVIAASGSSDRLAQVAELGAEEVINYLEEDFVTAVERITGGQGVSVVVEHIGTDTWAGSLRCLAPGGRLVTCGATTGSSVQLDLDYLHRRQNSVVGSRGGTKKELSLVLDLVAQGRLTAIVDEIYPLADVVEAHKRLDKRDVFGKLVLVP